MVVLPAFSFQLGRGEVLTTQSHGEDRFLLMTPSPPSSPGAGVLEQRHQSGWDPAPEMMVSEWPQVEGENPQPRGNRPWVTVPLHSTSVALPFFQMLMTDHNLSGYPGVFAGRGPLHLGLSCAPLLFTVQG